MPKAVQLVLNANLLPAGSRVCVAVSGGADSTALLLALQEQRVALGLGLSAAHVQHSIRPSDETDGDLAFLQQLCERLDVPLYVKHVDVPAAAQANRETVEEAARNARREFFRELIADGRATHVATAHTLDDQAETVMLKLLRGAWLEGLGGISPTVVCGPGKIVRPMLHLTRGEVEAFLKSRNQPWREDSTNASLDYTRNRVRHTLMPMLREFNPQIAGTLAATAELAREEEERAGREVQRLLPQLLLPGKPVRGGGRAIGTTPDAATVAIEIERLKALEMPLRRRVLRAAAANLGVRLSSAETLRLLRLCGLQPEDAPADGTVSAKPGAKLSLPGLVAERSAREVRLSASGR